ncbi:MAG TPA: radical SAM protein [Thermoanaerobaculia bacterium]|nr:radical SAM protein [Thermoanaerobaculia bacterium]
MKARRVVLISLCPQVAQDEGSAPTRELMARFPSYGISRIHAALASDPQLQDTDIIFMDARDATAEQLAARALEFEPDVLGVSFYVWSTATLCDVARRVKEERPECLVVAGGPSARPAVLDLAPFVRFRTAIDALVLGEGEETMRAIVRDPSRERLAGVPGLAIFAGDRWTQTGEPVRSASLDDIASPFQLDLMPSHHVTYLETFRGCPLSCTFCQWGVMDSGRHFSREYLVRELEAIKRSEPIATYLVDAGLNLNARAFRNLASAEEEVGLFQKTTLYCEVYPSLLNEEHLEFLRRASQVHIGLGLQSLDGSALAANQRPFKRERLIPTIEQLSRDCRVDIELILGLPGDTPESFRKTLEEVRKLPCSVRIYRCLILPDALMTRAPKEFAIRFDPQTLFMTSCHTWSERELRESQAYLDQVAAATPGGYAGDYWWHLLHDSPRYQTAYDRVAGQRGVTTSARGDARDV